MSNSALQKSLALLLRPVARFCLRHSLGLREIVETFKSVLVECAAAEMQKQESKVNLSRLATVTGVHRKDVARIYDRGEVYQEPIRLVSRVIQRWREDRDFLDSRRRPRILSYGGEHSEFADLVRRISSDVRSASVLFELYRIGAVKELDGGLKLLAKGYMPSRALAAEGYRLLALDTAELMDAVEANLKADKEPLPNYHGRITYDNVSVSELPAIRRWLFGQCARLHARAEKFIAARDLDLAPRKSRKGKGKVSLCIFTNTTGQEE